MFCPVNLVWTAPWGSGPRPRAACPPAQTNNFPTPVSPMSYVLVFLADEAVKRHLRRWATDLGALARDLENAIAFFTGSISAPALPCPKCDAALRWSYVRGFAPVDSWYPEIFHNARLTCPTGTVALLGFTPMLTTSAAGSMRSVSDRVLCVRACPCGCRSRSLPR